MRLVALVLVAFAPSVALAQNSTTTCRPYGFGQVRCDTQTQPSFGQAQPVPPIDYTGLMRPVPPPNAALNAYEAARAQSRQRLLDQVSPLMATGQCETARLLALRQGDGELAEMIYTTCKPR